MRKVSLLIILVLSLIVPLATAKLPTDVLQTIPPVTVSTKTAIAGCTILDVFPGSIVTGTSGYVQTGCSQNVPSIMFNGTTETPSFAFTLWTNMSLVLHGNGCKSPSIQNIGNFWLNATTEVSVPQLVRSTIISGNPVSFTPLVTEFGHRAYQNSTMILQPGGYDYCLGYNNPPSTGIATFTISWTP